MSQVDLSEVGWTTKDDKALEILWKSLISPPMSYSYEIELLEEEDTRVKLSKKSSKEQLQAVLKNSFAKYPPSHYDQAIFLLCSAESFNQSEKEEPLSEALILRRRLHHKARSIKRLWQDYKVFWASVKHEPKARKFWGLAYQRNRLVLNCGDKAVEKAEAFLEYNYNDLVSKLRQSKEITTVNTRMIANHWNPYGGDQFIGWHENEETQIPNYNFDTKFIFDRKLTGIK